MQAPTLNVSLDAPPTTPEVVLSILQAIAAQNGTITDANQGSQVRAFSSAIGATIEQQSIATQVEMVQYAVQGAFSIFGISPGLPQYSTGNVVFSLGYTATSTIYIPLDTQLSSIGGINFFTTSAASILAGQSSVSVPIQSQSPGSIANVTANSITQIVSTLPYPLTVNNPAPTAGGSDAESFSSTLSRFNNLAQSLGRSTPQAIASSVIGVTASGGEKVQYSTCYEPWVAQAASGVTSGYTIGYDVYVDNGSGAASSSLLSAVSGVLSGTPDYGPAGVPYNVYAVDPVYVAISVDGTATPEFAGVIPTITTAVQNATNSYFASLQFSDPYVQAILLEQIANATYGWLSALSVSNTPSGSSVTVGPTQRAVLSGLVINIGT